MKCRVILDIEVIGLSTKHCPGCDLILPKTSFGKCTKAEGSVTQKGKRVYCTDCRRSEGAYGKRLRRDSTPWKKTLTDPITGKKTKKLTQSAKKWKDLDKGTMDMIFKNRPAGYHIDHQVPTVHKNICGLNVSWNLQYLLASENSAKQNKLLPEFCVCVILKGN